MPCSWTLVCVCWWYDVIVENVASKALTLQDQVHHPFLYDLCGMRKSLCVKGRLRMSRAFQAVHEVPGTVAGMWHNPHNCHGLCPRAEHSSSESPARRPAALSPCLPSVLCSLRLIATQHRGHLRSSVSPPTTCATVQLHTVAFCHHMVERPSSVAPCGKFF